MLNAIANDRDRQVWDEMLAGTGRAGLTRLAAYREEIEAAAHADIERLREALKREANSHETLARKLEAYPEQSMQSYYHSFVAKCIRATLASDMD